MTTTDQDVDDAISIIERSLARYRAGDVLALDEMTRMLPVDVRQSVRVDWFKAVAAGARNGNSHSQRLAIEAVGRLRRGE